MGLKKFLDDNKIYFETVCIICVSLMSIIISINANSIATTANIIAENDLKVQKANNQPIFVFNETRYGNGFFEKLKVYNIGAPINSFSISAIVLLRAHSYEDNKYKEIVIPIGYYDISTRNVSDIGELQEFFSSENEPLNGNYYRLAEAIGDSYEISRTNNVSMNINFDKYVYITYEDLYSEKHNDLYIISSFYPYKISANEKDKVLFNIQESLKDGYLDIKYLTAEKIFTIFKNRKF